MSLQKLEAKLILNISNNPQLMINQTLKNGSKALSSF